MEATRYRLRFITGVALTAATYGSGTYGAGTYGEQASDALSALRYIAVPYPSGYLADPSWIYRQGDTEPDLRLAIVADTGFLDLAGVNYAHLVLTSTDGAAATFPLMYELTVVTLDGDDWLTRSWHEDDLNVPGSYRVGVVVQYDSGRRLTVPADDRHNFVITPNSTFDPPTIPLSRWSQARWNLAYWSEGS